MLKLLITKLFLTLARRAFPFWQTLSVTSSLFHPRTLPSLSSPHAPLFDRPPLSSPSLPSLYVLPLFNPPHVPYPLTDPPTLFLHSIFVLSSITLYSRLSPLFHACTLPSLANLPYVLPRLNPCTFSLSSIPVRFPSL